MFGHFPKWKSTSVPLSGGSCYCYSAIRFKSEWFHSQGDKRGLPCAKKYLVKDRDWRVRGAYLFHRGRKTEISFFHSGKKQDIPKLIRKISPIWKINGWIMATFYLGHLRNILWWRRMKFQVNKPIFTYFFTYLFVR